MDPSTLYDLEYQHGVMVHLSDPRCSVDVSIYILKRDATALRASPGFDCQVPAKFRDRTDLQSNSNSSKPTNGIWALVINGRFVGSDVPAALDARKSSCWWKIM